MFSRDYIRTNTYYYVPIHAHLPVWFTVSSSYIVVWVHSWLRRAFFFFFLVLGLLHDRNGERRNPFVYRLTQSIYLYCAFLLNNPASGCIDLCLRTLLKNYTPTTPLLSIESYIRACVPSPFAYIRTIFHTVPRYRRTSP